MTLQELREYAIALSHQVETEREQLTDALQARITTAL